MNARKTKRQLRIRSKIQGTVERPRLSVFRSNKYIFAQLIDDASSKTILGASEKNLAKKEGTKSERAKALGLMLAGKAKAKKISKIIFDKGSYAYHGRVKGMAEGLREGGMEF